MKTSFCYFLRDCGWGSLQLGCAAWMLFVLGCGQAADSGGPAFVPVEPSAVAESSPEAERPSSDGSEDGEFISFPGAGVRVIQPSGFKQSETFDGFEHAASSSSIMAVKLPGPFAEVSAGFTEANLAARGLKLLSREELQHAGQAAILVHFEQSQLGSDYLKWSLLFESDQETAIITATFLKERAAEYSNVLKAAVLSTRLDDSGSVDPLADLDFTVVCSAKLQLATTMSRGAFYTQDGVMRQQSAENPLFLVGPSLMKVTVTDFEDFSERRIKATAETANVIIRSHKPVKIDGFSGFESEADAEDRASGAPLVVYQVMLFPEDAYVVMQGLVGAKQAENFLPEFKAMAHSFKMKR